MSDDHPAVIDYRVGLVERAVQDIGLALTAIKESLQTLAVLETRHAETRESLARAFRTIEDMDDRISVIEHGLPLLNLTSKWVRGGVIAIVGLVGVAVIKFVMVVH
jgi:hypothetical protein